MNLSESLKDLQLLVSKIENGEDLKIEQINTSIGNFKDTIDKRISVIENLDNYCKFIGEKAKELSQKEKTLKNALKNERKIMNLSESLKDLQLLVSKIENGEDLKIEQINTSIGNFKDTIDKRISVIENLDNYCKFIGEKAKELSQKEKTLKNALKNIKEYTKWQIEQNPELEWRGTTKSFSLRKASQSAKDWRIKTDKLENIIPIECLEYVPKKYYREHVVYLLDKEKVKEDLKDNAEALFNVCRDTEKTTYLAIK